MIFRTLLFTVTISLVSSLCAQDSLEVKFFKDRYMQKETVEKKANYKHEHFYDGYIEVKRLVKVLGNWVLWEERYLNNLPVGKWLTRDNNNDLIINDFSILKYRKDTKDSIMEQSISEFTFPGGTEGLQKFLGENIVFPFRALEEGIKGKVVINIKISPDGSVEPFVIEKGVHPLLDLAAWQLVGKMPKWKLVDEKGDGKPSFYILPIHFHVS